MGSNTLRPLNVRRRVLHVGAALALGAGLLTPVMADTLLIEGLHQARDSGTARPDRGTSMAAVESQWGTPVSRSGPVGQPPITRWQYADFEVFFEYDHVIHSVRR